MKLVTASQMRSLDKAATEKYGIVPLDLMERAGKGVADLVVRHFPKRCKVIIFTGKGNNGGDGLVAAGYLVDYGYSVTICLLSPWTDFSPDARVNWDELAGKNVDIIDIVSESDLRKEHTRLSCADVVVDAIFGTGLSSEVTGKYRAVIEYINSLSKPVVAVDIPSGLSADTGQPLGVAVRARFTAALGALKVGLVTATGMEYAREVELIDIGIPAELLDNADTGYELVTPEMIAGFLPSRKRSSHKGDFGHLLVVAGSVGKIGAGLLSCRAALRVGAGLVTYALPETAYVKFDTKSPEVMYEGIADDGKGRFTRSSLPSLRALLQTRDVLAIGPGIGTDRDTAVAVSELVKRSLVPVIIDADGLNCIADTISVLDSHKGGIIMTPHPGEMSRLNGMPVKKIQTDRINVARTFARTHKLYLVLKGARTVISTPDGRIYINPTGNPGMATAGTGDVLTGMIGGLIAQNMSIENAVVAAVYVHGLAGDIAAKEMTERGMIASDVINCIPKALRTLDLEP